MKAELQSHEKTAASPPGPVPIFPALNLISLIRTPLQFLDRAAQYGEVVKLVGGERGTYLLTNPDDIRDVLVTHHRQFVKSPVLQRMKSFLGEGLLTSEGDLHLRQRRLIQPAFHRERIQMYGQIMTGYALQTSRRWEDCLDGRSHLQIDIHQEMMRLTMVIVGQALFGTNVEQEAAEIGSLIKIMLAGSDRLLLPFWERIQRLPLPGNRELFEAGVKLDGVIRRMIADRREAAERGESRYTDLMDLLLRARDEEGSGGMSDQLVRDEVMTLFLAGHETTANALTWTWYLLSQHPEVEEKLHAELAQVLGGRVPEAGDVDRLVYTRKVLSESMRLYPPAWIIGREALADYRVRDYVLPAGSTVVMSQWVVHHDPRYYPDPLRFDPERWNPDAIAARPRFAYFPFGGGPRVCIGEPFAWMEGILILAALAQRWSMRLAPDQRIEPLGQVTLRPKYGMKMQISRRPAVD